VQIISTGDCIGEDHDDTAYLLDLLSPLLLDQEPIRKSLLMCFSMRDLLDLAVFSPLPLLRCSKTSELPTQTMSGLSNASTGAVQLVPSLRTPDQEEPPLPTLPPPLVDTDSNLLLLPPLDIPLDIPPVSVALTFRHSSLLIGTH
jgi:hypothetical protein